MTSTPTAALDADLRALRDAAYQEGYHAGNVAALCEVANAAESRLRTTFARLSDRITALEQENSRLRIVEVDYDAMCTILREHAAKHARSV